MMKRKTYQHQLLPLRCNERLFDSPIILKAMIALSQTYEIAVYCICAYLTKK